MNAYTYRKALAALLAKLHVIGDKRELLLEDTKANGTLMERIGEWRAAAAERRAILDRLDALSRRAGKRIMLRSPLTISCIRQRLRQAE